MTNEAKPLKILNSEHFAFDQMASSERKVLWSGFGPNGTMTNEAKPLKILHRAYFGSDRMRSSDPSVR